MIIYIVFFIVVSQRENETNVCKSGLDAVSWCKLTTPVKRKKIIKEFENINKEITESDIFIYSLLCTCVYVCTWVCDGGI